MDNVRMLQVNMYSFLSKFQPINVDAFHARCSSLLEEKMMLMERRRLSQIARVSATMGP